MNQTFFYQVEVCVKKTWIPVPGQRYACLPGEFRQMLNLLGLLPSQRIKRVGDIRHFSKHVDTLSKYWILENWEADYFYKEGCFQDWPKNPA